MAELWRAWLAVVALVMGLAAGAVFSLMMVRLIPGRWRDSLTAPLTRLSLASIPAAVLAAPILIVPGQVYPWAQDGGRGWMSHLGFAVRGVLWLGLLVALALRARAPVSKPLATISLLVLTPFSTLAAFDWLLSLDGHYSGSGFGLYALALWIHLALCTAVVLADEADVAKRGILGGVVLTTTVLWAYLAYMQFFIAWSGNLPASVDWFRAREGGWSAFIWIAATLRLGGGALLISGAVRRSRRWLRVIAVGGALAALPETLWLVLP